MTSNEREPSNVVRFFGQLLALPIVAFVHSIEVIIRTMQGVQQVSNQGMRVMAGPQAGIGMAPETDIAVAQQVSGSAIPTADNAGIRDEITNQEEKPLTTNGDCTSGQEKDLHDDMLKLVRYNVLFVRREYEVAFPEQEDLVSDNMDGSAFTAWKIAEFIQNLAIKDPANIPPTHIAVPQKWIDKSYAQEYWTDSEKGGYLSGIPHEDKKYLRVYFEVLERYPREKFKYEEQQIRVLEEIRDKL